MDKLNKMEMDITKGIKILISKKMKMRKWMIWNSNWSMVWTENNINRWENWRNKYEYNFIEYLY